MRVGILGSGLMGAKLGAIFARAGHEVVFSYARSNDKLKRLARDAKSNARAAVRQPRRRKMLMPFCWPFTGREWTMC